METKKFFSLVKRHRYALIIFPILVMGITYFLVRKLPDIYTSQSRLSAGLTAGSQTMQIAQQLLNGENNIADSKINQTFSNVTQTMQLKIVYDQVSYLLILHDLTANEAPFRKPSKLLGYLNEDSKKHAVDVFTRLYKERKALLLTDKDQKGLNDVLISMKYNYEALKDKVKIFRVENSDFIDVAYESENPAMSAFVVNALCNEFIGYYASLNQQNKLKSVDYLYELVSNKKDSLNVKLDELRKYKAQHEAYNITDQTTGLYGQISEMEGRLRDAEREVEANTEAINGIDNKFNAEEKEYMESTLTSVNQDIVATQDKLNKLNDQYVKSNFDPTIKENIDILKAVLTQKINKSTDKYIVNPLVSKESLIAQKLKLENDRSLAQGSISSIKYSIAMLNMKMHSLAPNESVIQAMQADIDETQKEYIDLLSRYNSSAMQLTSTVPIKVIEMALPGGKQPSKKAVSVILSGVLSFVVYMLILFILFYLDDSVRVADDLSNKTDTRVLGALPMIKTSFLDMQKLWAVEPIGVVGPEVKKLIGAVRNDIKKLPGKNGKSPVNTEFKKLIRSTRFEINMALMGGRNLVITSLVEEEGKTLICLSMVSAFQMMNKKVLLIDGNFLNPGITMMTKPKYFIEDYLRGRTSLDEVVDEGNITVLGNKGMDVSLFEINTEEQIEQRLLELKDIFDIIFIEASALE